MLKEAPDIFRPRDTFWTLRSPEPGARKALETPRRVGHSLGHPPFSGILFGTLFRALRGHFGPEGPRDSCNRPGSSQFDPSKLQKENRKLWKRALLFLRHALVCSMYQTLVEKIAEIAPYFRKLEKAVAVWGLAGRKAPEESCWNKKTFGICEML